MLQHLYLALDGFLIVFYRLSEVPIVGFMIGTAVLAVLAVLLGQVTQLVALRYNLRHFCDQNSDMVRMHNLSIFALLAKDKAAYKACNKEANDAFGRYFFAQLALSISSLWPAAFALAWMNTRFSDVDFVLPFIDATVGYTFSFLPLFILMYILFGQIRRRLPIFQSLDRNLAEVNDSAGEMVSLADLHPRQTAPRA